MMRLVSFIHVKLRGLKSNEEGKSCAQQLVTIQKTIALDDI